MSTLVMGLTVFQPVFLCSSVWWLTAQPLLLPQAEESEYPSRMSPAAVTVA